MTVTFLEQMFGLQGRVALVTGARHGIGAEVALALQAAGAEVAVAARRKPDLQQTLDSLGAGGKALGLGFDVRDPEGAEEAVQQVVQEFGRLDILVNNAGVTLRAAALDYAAGDLESVLQSNLTSAFHLSCAAAPHMVRLGGGRIVNVSSMYARVAHAERAAYIASKAGLEGLTRALAAEWGPSGITVNAVAPGTTRTPSREEIQSDPEFLGARLKRIPLGRLGEGREMAAAVLFLSGPGGGYMTGQTLVVDGGFSVV